MNALTATLEAAMRQLAQGDVAAATRQIQAFINQGNTFVTGGVLSSEDGRRLILMAEAISDDIHNGLGTSGGSQDILEITRGKRKWPEHSH